jgi:hypothetical protein
VRQLPAIDLNIQGQLSMIAQFKYGTELSAIPVERTSPNSFAFHNGFFEAGDAEMLYNMIRHFKPKRIVEIGCGHSTLIALKAEAMNRLRDPGYSCRHICIEPFEQPLLEDTGAEVIR